MSLPAFGTAGIEDYLGFLAASATDILSSDSPTPEEFETAAASISENGFTYEACYIAGLDPTDETAKFEARIEIGVDGKPVVKWSPDLNENGTKNERVYRVLGAKELGAAAQWDDVTDLQDYGAEHGYRFFKVDVELP